MEPTIERLDINVNKVKITLTPTRFALKVPLGMSEETAASYIAFAKRVSSLVGTPTQALRGNIRQVDGVLSVQLKKDNKDALEVIVDR